MAKIERFEDLNIWVKAREIAKNVYTACNQGKFASDFGLRDQMQRAAVSIMSNLESEILNLESIYGGIYGIQS
jgi:hypothetical protein